MSASPDFTALAQKREMLAAGAAQAKREEGAARRRAKRLRRELAALESYLTERGITFENRSSIDTGPGGSHSHDRADAS